MRISRNTIHHMAADIARKLMAEERDALAEKMRDLGKRLLVIAYKGQEKALKKLGSPWVREDKTFRMMLRESGDVDKRYVELQVSFEEPVIVPNTTAYGFEVDLQGHSALMNEVVAIRRLDLDLNKRFASLQHELIGNIEAAKTFERLTKAWPEEAELIAAYCPKPLVVEIPLASIAGRYAAAPALEFVQAAE